MNLTSKVARYGLLATLLAASASFAGQQKSPPLQATDAEITEAFLYAYPYHEFMKLRHRALYDAASPTYTALNSLRHQRHLTTPDDRWANGPINDAFYSTTWLNVADSPVVLTLPDTADRYYVVVLIGADTNSFAYVGRRATGTKARRVAIVGPDWQGPIPAADQVVRAPTRDVYVNMRVRVYGPDDVASANAVQDGFQFVSVSGPASIGEPQAVPIDGDAQRFIAVVNEALARNPPPVQEAAMIDRFRKVGICGKDCSWSQLPPELQSRWRALMPAIITKLKSALNADRRDVDRTNGWRAFRLPFNFGNNYRMRAGSAANSGGVFGVEAAEATYFSASVDASGAPLAEGKRYKLHLPHGGLPADAFWSVSLYEFQADGQYLLANPIQRYAIGAHTKGLQRNSDGSLDIFIQPTEPGSGMRANWLPSPASNRFYLMARIYQPRPEVLDPAWVLPPVVQAGQ